jgi:hypothetical protein
MLASPKAARKVARLARDFSSLFHLFMRRMLAATPAKFPQLQPVRSGLPVLGGRIISLFALTALQCNDLSGHRSLPKTQLVAPSFGLVTLRRHAFCSPKHRSPPRESARRAHPARC